LSSLKDFLTLQKAANIEYLVQKSRFIGSATPVLTEEDALAHIKQVRAVYKAATHYCYAYIIGENAGIMRYQDDGEPSGTAGVPILEALRQNQVVNACVVVTRYFGGILLGAGGLTRAYSHTAAQAIKEAGLALVEQSIRLTIQIGYPHWDKLEYLLSQRPVTDINKAFSAQVKIDLVVRLNDSESLIQEVLDSTLGQADIQESDPFPWQWPVEDR
jgi:uncharacterized YigZ family protein